MPWFKFDEKQWEEFKRMLDGVVNVADRIATEMKRSNDLKEKELQREDKGDG